MTLSIRLAVGGTTYALKADKLNQNIGKNPTIIPLPASGTANEPIQIDLGGFKNKISFEGIVDDIDSLSDGAIAIPSKNELEDFILDNSGSIITLTIFYENNGALTDTNTYQAFALDCNFERMGGQDSRWTYKLQFNAGRRTST